MEYQVLFWVLITLMAIQILGIYAIGQSIKSLVTSKKFKERLLNKTESGKDLGKKIVSVLIVLSIGMTNSVFAESPTDLPARSIGGRFYL